MPEGRRVTLQLREQEMAKMLAELGLNGLVLFDLEL